MINYCHISSEDFLEDVKYEIKRQFKNQDSFAEKVFISRKRLNRILNNADELTTYWINQFCEKLGLDLRSYIFDQISGTQVLFCYLFWDKSTNCFLKIYSVVVERQEERKNEYYKYLQIRKKVD